MEKYWFIEDSFFKKYQVAVDLGYTPEVSAEELEQIRANADAWASPRYASDNLRVKDGVAHIDVKGVMLESASFIDELYAKYLGQVYTTYPGLEAQIEAAENNDFVKKIRYHFDTPGGMMAGVDNAAMRIATSTKPSEAYVGWSAASAGYYLASQADKIVAKNPTSSVGSIGVVVDLVDATKAYEKYGIRRYSITSKAAPKKRPEPHSEEFVAQIEDRLDELHAIFATRVAEGRSRATGKTFTAEQVNENFGQGGMVIAAEAQNIGMIDEILNMSSKPNQEASMTPEEKAEVDVRIEAAKTEGIEQERARVAALLPWMGADSERVMKAINEGEAVSPALVTELSQKMAAKSAEEAEAQRQADEEARLKAAAEERVSDEAPVISGAETEDERTDDEKAIDDAFSAIRKRQGKA